MVYLLIFIFAIYLIIMLVIGRQLAYNDIFSKPKPDKRGLEGYDIQDIEFNGKDNVLLKGWFVKSKNNIEGKTLVLLHGWTRSRINLIEYIKLFSDNGFHILAYDQRSHGYSGTGLVTYGTEEGTDLIHGVEFLKKQFQEVNGSKIGLVAFSLGTGAAVYGTVLSNNSLFKLLVLEGVFNSSFDVGSKMLKDTFGKYLGKVVEFFVFTVGVQIWSLGKFSHSETGLKVKEISNIPILIVRGENDKMVTSTSAYKFIESINSSKTIWVHSENMPEDDLGHVNSIKLYPKEYKEKVLNFINDNI